jgi:hypothetical protein
VTDCTFCGCAVAAHDPVYVEERSEETGERVPAGSFCDYACLVAHVEAESLRGGDP